jgi:NitT/TauT family transport system permease protein
MASVKEENKVSVFFQGLIGVILFILLWEFAPRFGWVDPFLIPSFSSVIKSLIEFTTSGDLFIHAAVSIRRAGIGFCCATIIAIPLAFIVGWFTQIRNFLNPVLQLLRQLPTLALFPALMLVFGIGEVSKVIIIGKACFWPIFLNTVTAVSEVDPLLVKSARSMCLSRVGMFRKIVLPSIFPSVFTGFRMSATYAIVTLVAAEMMGANAGLGYTIFHAQSTFTIPLMYGGILIFILLGLTTHYGLAFIEKKISSWKQELIT